MEVIFLWILIDVFLYLLLRVLNCSPVEAKSIVNAFQNISFYLIVILLLLITFSFS